MWFALAAYNVGLGHLEDARVITQKQGSDPNVWADVSKHLPLLSQQQWFQDTRHGYARGYEPVKFVRKIRHYIDALTRLEAPRDLPEKPVVAARRADSKAL
jgi:membrane-bound lytic murein transglycosylase F